MDKIKEEPNWRSDLKILLLLLLIGAAIKLGGMTLVLSHDLKISECAAGYWKAKAQGHSNYCQPGCTCDVRMVR